MANRQHDHPPSDRGSGSSRPWDEDDKRSSHQSICDYGPYVESDEGESSVRAGSYDQGRARSAGGREISESGSPGPAANTGETRHAMTEDRGGHEQGISPQSNYREPSDARVKEMLWERLRDDPEIDAAEVSIQVQGGRITLEGTVDSRSTLRAIEDVAEQIGAEDVQNNLSVQQPGERSMQPEKSALDDENGEQAKQKRN